MPRHRAGDGDTPAAASLLLMTLLPSTRAIVTVGQRLGHRHGLARHRRTGCRWHRSPAPTPSRCRWPVRCASLAGIVALQRGAGRVHGGDIGLGHAIVGDRDVEGRCWPQSRSPCRSAPPRRRHGLGKVDDVVAVDRGDRHRRAGLGHRHGLAATVAWLPLASVTCADTVAVPLASAMASLEGIVALQAVPAAFTVAI